MVTPRQVGLLDLQELERLKFDVNADEEVIVRTSMEGTFTASGLRQAIRITTMLITDTAIALPAVALTGRNSVTIHNKSSTLTLYVGPSDVVAGDDIGTTAGYEIPPNSFLNFDVSADILLFGVVASGQSIKVKIMELA